MSWLQSVAVKSALITAVYLFGGFGVGLGLGLLVSDPGMHVTQLLRNVLAGLITLAVISATSAAWARAMARMVGAREPKRLAWAAALSFGPAAILSALVLAWLEVVLLERGSGPALPIHIAFTILFVPAVFFVAGITGWALGFALRDKALAARLALRTGFAAAAAFLVADIMMDLIGWRVGAPGAAERATMITVLLVGNLGAALAGGTIVGTSLFGHISRQTGAAESDATLPLR